MDCISVHVLSLLFLLSHAHALCSCQPVVTYLPIGTASVLRAKVHPSVRCKNWVVSRMTYKSMTSGDSLGAACPQVPGWWHWAVQHGPVTPPEQVMCAGRAWGRMITCLKLLPENSQSSQTEG